MPGSRGVGGGGTGGLDPLWNSKNLSKKGHFGIWGGWGGWTPPHGGGGLDPPLVCDQKLPFSLDTQ